MINSSLKMTGGEEMQARLQKLARDLATKRHVKVGFLRDEEYDRGDGGARLAERAKTAERDGHPEWAARLAAWAKWAAEHPRSLSVAQVAFWMEFGTRNHGPRPFFRTTIANQSAEWGRVLAQNMVNTKLDVATSLGRTGLRMAEDVRDTINGWPADNSELTHYIKGFNKGLSDSMRLARAVNYEVSS